MSGGSHDYIYSKLEYAMEEGGGMFDEELDKMIADLIPLLKDLEWWQSGDTSEESYRKTAARFKEKWLYD